MSPRTLAPIAAIVSLVGGGIGLIAPEAMAAAFGISLDQTGSELLRLACTAYLGYGVLNWSARTVTDGTAWRAIAGANALSWGAGTVVVVAWIIGVTGPVAGVDARPWAFVAMQVVFTGAWSLAYAQTVRLAERAAPSTV